MMQHQHNVLASLGIDIWVPRQAVSQVSTEQSIWRDQEVVELNSKNEIAPTQPIVFDHQILKEKIVPPTQELVDDQLTDHALLGEVVKDVVEVAPFSLQALIIYNALILIDATNFTQEQEALWLNLSKLSQQSLQQIKWPYAVSTLQDGIGASVYVQGFVDCLKTNKKILSLGKLPIQIAASIQATVSLQEMLDKPASKKILWDQIRQTL